MRCAAAVAPGGRPSQGSTWQQAGIGPPLAPSLKVLPGALQARTGSREPPLESLHLPAFPAGGRVGQDAQLGRAGHLRG